MKLGKKMVTNVYPLFIPKKTVIQKDFNYVLFLNDLYNFRHKGISEGYFSDLSRFENVDDVLFELRDSPKKSNKIEEHYQTLSKVGNLNLSEYQKILYSLHIEFEKRFLSGEKLDIINDDIVIKMFELATRNNDGTHTDYGVECLKNTNLIDEIFEKEQRLRNKKQEEIRVALEKEQRLRDEKQEEMRVALEKAQKEAEEREKELNDFRESIKAGSAERLQKFLNNELSLSELTYYDLDYRNNPELFKDNKELSYYSSLVSSKIEWYFDDDERYLPLKEFFANHKGEKRKRRR